MHGIMEICSQKVNAYTVFFSLSSTNGTVLEWA